MKRLYSILAFALISVFTLSAQKNVVISHDYMIFSAIDVADNFEISITEADAHSVKLTAASSIEDYVQAYVKDAVLYLDIDEKSMPKELRKEFNAKNSIISTVKAEISISAITSVNVHGNSVVDVADTLNAGKFTLKLSKSAIVKNLNVESSSSVVLDLGGKSQTFMYVSVPALEISASNTAKAEIKSKSDRLSVNASSFAKVEVFGKADSVSLSSEGNAKVEYNAK